MENVTLMVVAALMPFGKDFAHEKGVDAGNHVRDLVASTENTLDDSAIEIAKVALKGMLEGLEPDQPEQPALG